MNYLLDINVCIALLNNNKSTVRIHFEEAVKSGSLISVSTIVAFELWYGAYNSQRQERNKERIESFLGSMVQALLFDERDAQEAGALRTNCDPLADRSDPTT